MHKDKSKKYLISCAIMRFLPFPPSTLTIEQLQILDISGREVLTITPDLNISSFEINIHDLCAGIYMLRVNQSVLKRLVVIK